MVHPDMIAIAVLKELGVPPAGHKINIIAAALRAYGAECAAQEREENRQVVIGLANSVPADVPYSGYLAYKLAIRNAIAAIRIRALT